MDGEGSTGASPEDEKNVLILVDYQPLVYAAKSNAPKAFSYNTALGTLTKYRPNTRFFFAFVPGVRNVADGLSRGESSVNKDLVSSVAGSGNCRGLPRYNLLCVGSVSRIFKRGFW
eukprot:Tbor_TRINITY_DN5681_c1_g1::TRINITY_DN5681_c1_g1_i1::g.8624::m.8624